MSTFLGFLWSAISDMIGIKQWFHDRSEQSEGAMKQQLADAQAEHKEEAIAHETENQTDALSDADVAEQLRHYTKH